MMDAAITMAKEALAIEPEEVLVGWLLPVPDDGPEGVVDTRVLLNNKAIAGPAVPWLHNPFKF